MKNILIISPFFSPNIGGVETHLDDLVDALNQSDISSVVLTYSPLTTPGTKWTFRQTVGLCRIFRFPWFGKNLFHRLEIYPLFDFLYLTPYLFFISFFWMCFHYQQIDTIHSHGINAAFIGDIIAHIFHKRHINSTHAIYENISGFSKHVSVFVYNHTDTILCLSKKSLSQLRLWGVNRQLLKPYRYWINLDIFRLSKQVPKNFTVLYAGRIISKKGIPQLLEAAFKLPNIKFIFAGTGPFQQILIDRSHLCKNITYLGPIPNRELPRIYRQASIFCLPSQYTEGYGRAVMEAVASGLPVIGSNLGSIGEALDSSVSILFKPTVQNIIHYIRYLSENSLIYNNLRKSCRPYALKNFSLKNFDLIKNSY
jgi:glycosyltransferase involved in cell wall biosynthesis